MTAPKSNAERLQRLYEAFDSNDLEEAGKLIVVSTRLVGTARETSIPLRQDLSLVNEFVDGLAGCAIAYDSPAEALEAAQKGRADSQA